MSRLRRLVSPAIVDDFLYILHFKSTERVLLISSCSAHSWTNQITTPYHFALFCPHTAVTAELLPISTTLFVTSSVCVYLAVGHGSPNKIPATLSYWPFRSFVDSPKYEHLPFLDLACLGIYNIWQVLVSNNGVCKIFSTETTGGASISPVAWLEWFPAMSYEG